MSQKLQIDTGTGDLLAEVRDHVGVLTLNRPKARNALSSRLSAALGEMIKCFGEDPQVRSILITGAGAAFCAGADVKGMDQTSPLAEATFEERVDDLRVKQRAVWGALVAVRKPTIAAIPGAAAGAGLALALACDIRVAAQSAILTTAYARVALSGDCGIAWLLTRMVGFSRARELMFLSERIDAHRAEALGLVNRVVLDADLPEAGFALAASLAEGPTLTFGCIKNNLDYAATAGFVESMDYEAENLIRTELSLDHKEGVRAFAEKRKPAFEGH
ncbi:enoyl-CoA hydratase/isomerase family protein [Bradyrhizobium sp. SRL28]|uniref:enoyl-CoA hydratase-related protein n=1 Tax=Bradyrhizobium sp. SRL28 TaxID=2836178 RepID=UPI001BDE67F8|nr:enoyl-CoA hydratase-related protein [Bradyrhizobium sp. SRL28]MBT1516779.1 enoyl-CoA hydratase/isomerase family protein [Bradyrhizobium sp. SRL28]